MEGYKSYCREAYEHQVRYFVPTNPAQLDENWFERTKDWYDKKETGQVPGQPIGFHYWAVDGDAFIGEFQLRTELTPELMTGIGNIGYAVRVSQQGKGYGTQILTQGLEIAKSHEMKKVLLNINEANVVSIHVCEKLGGKRMDKIQAFSKAEGDHTLCRYWIEL